VLNHALLKYRPGQFRRGTEYGRSSRGFTPHIATSTPPVWRVGDDLRIARQAYEEVREDRHPIVFISGRDITEILIQNGKNTTQLVGEYLANEFLC
jgi:hypothetical protein